MKQQLAAERDYFRMSRAILEDDAHHLIQFYEENPNSSNDAAETAFEAWGEPMDILYMPPPQPRCNISTGSEPQK